jgi:hypothetical protein
MADLGRGYHIPVSDPLGGDQTLADLSPEVSIAVSDPLRADQRPGRKPQSAQGGALHIALNGSV